MEEEIVRDTPKVHWTDGANGNKWMQRISPMMLMPGGVIEGRNIKLPGHSFKQWVNVIYDKSYVFSKITNDLIHPMNFDSLERCLLFICDIWEFLISNDEMTKEVNAMRLKISQPPDKVHREIAEEVKVYRLRGEEVIKVADIQKVLPNCEVVQNGGYHVLVNF